MKTVKKTTFARYVDAEIAADAGLRRRVKTLLGEMRSDQTLAARRERSRVAPVAIEDDAPPISAAWRKEIDRRIKDMNDPIRYVILSAFSRRLLLYYDASSDSLPANDIASATLFKRLAVAEAVMGALGSHYVLMKVRLQKNGSIKRLLPLREILAEAQAKRRRPAARTGRGPLPPP